MKEPLAWEFYKKVYNVLDFNAIREPLSHELMIREGVAAQSSFDCLPLYIAKNYTLSGVQKNKSIVVAGSVVMRNIETAGSMVEYIHRMSGKGYKIRLLAGASMLPAPDDEQFIQRLKAACPGRWELVKASSLTAWLDTIAGASLLVSGRFHHTIAAAMMGTPFILLNSNTPKNSGLATVLGSEPPLVYDEQNLVPLLLNRTEEKLADSRSHENGIDMVRLEKACDQAMHNFLGL
jgi:polysaccharide pyruvyl transferase WcaK-like protein